MHAAGFPHWVSFALGILQFQGLSHTQQLGKLRCAEWQGLHSFMKWAREGQTWIVQSRKDVVKEAGNCGSPQERT